MPAHGVNVAHYSIVPAGTFSARVKELLRSLPN